MEAHDIIEKLKLQPHPEGGHFRETFRDPGQDARDHSTAIYYLLQDGEVSHWHRVDAAEVWHFYAGAHLELSLSEKPGGIASHILGNEISNGARPQIIIPKGVWQSAKSLGDWTLVGCTVAPGFEFSGFELAPKGWMP
jgi:predicted cupin superfamily sugar epimerase